jgi:rhamnosyltransferase
MIPNGVCAIVVTYHPHPDVVANIEKTREQVEALLVIDNGSSALELALLLAAQQKLEFDLIQNHANLGVAAAFNRGVRLAISHGHHFVVLFDQDSIISAGFIAAMLDCHKSHPQRATVVLVTPKHIEPETGFWERPPFANDGSPLTAMTSGSLMPVESFERCGGFEEDLIIDRVDDEYCLRARSKGYILALCEKAILYHSVGKPRMHSFLGIKTVKATHHSAARYYYLSRNRIVMIRRYWRQYPRWSYFQARSILRDLVVNFVVEDRRWAKLCTTLRGVLDGLRGRLGMVVPL